MNLFPEMHFSPKSDETIPQWVARAKELLAITTAEDPEFPYTTLTRLIYIDMCNRAGFGKLVETLSRGEEMPETTIAMEVMRQHISNLMKSVTGPELREITGRLDQAALDTFEHYDLSIIRKITV